MAGTTQPIKSRLDVERLKDYYRSVKPNARNYAMIVVGLNSALRIGDLLTLKWRNVYDFRDCCLQERVELVEQKTGKKKTFPINVSVQDALIKLFREQEYPQPNDYIFVGWQGKHLSRTQAFRIVSDAAQALSLGSHISCHSLRKTFGYHAYKMGVAPSLLMELFNHSSYQVTKRYLGLNQDEKDEVYLNLNL